MENYSDEQLVVKYLKGEKKTLDVLIKRYLQSIYSFCFRFIGNNQEAAEDITQDVFVKVWRNLKKFNKNKKFKTWIFTIAKNTCLDWLKKKRLILFSELNDDDSDNFFMENIPDDKPLPDELLERKDIADILEKAINSLSFKYRLVLWLHYNDHFTFQEIADILGESINTIKTRHWRGVARLKEILTKENETK